MDATQPTTPSIIRAEITRWRFAVEDAIREVADREEELEAPIWDVFNRIIVHVPPEFGREDLFAQFNRALAAFGPRWAREFHRRYTDFLTLEDSIEEDEAPATND